MKTAFSVAVAALAITLAAGPALAGGWHFGFGSGGSHAPSYGYRHGSGWGNYGYPKHYGSRGHSYGHSYRSYREPYGTRYGYGKPYGFTGNDYRYGGYGTHRHSPHCRH